MSPAIKTRSDPRLNITATLVRFASMAAITARMVLTAPEASAQTTSSSVPAVAGQNVEANGLVTPTPAPKIVNAEAGTAEV
jgi:hypothetical protein